MSGEAVSVMDEKIHLITQIRDGKTLDRYQENLTPPCRLNNVGSDQTIG
jgi:hypothetical protein